MSRLLLLVVVVVLVFSVVSVVADTREKSRPRQCKDGTFTKSHKRGACSHHGGLKKRVTS